MMLQYLFRVQSEVKCWQRKITIIIQFLCLNATSWHDKGLVCNCKLLNLMLVQFLPCCVFRKCILLQCVLVVYSGIAMQSNECKLMLTTVAYPLVTPKQSPKLLTMFKNITCYEFLFDLRIKIYNSPHIFCNAVFCE